MSGALRKIFGWGLRNKHENVCLRAVLKKHIQLAYQQGKIKVVYDIGAHKGDWTAEWKRTLPQAEFYLFEANSNMAGHLKKAGSWFATVPLSDVAKDVTFYTRDGTGDSLYKEVGGKYDVPSAAVSARTVRLDDLMVDSNLPLPDFIKIDVQGSEVDVLRGGSKAFGVAKYLLSEMPLVEYNKGAPSIDAYLSAYAQHGFQPVLIGEIHRKAGRLVQIDMLFEKFDQQ